MVSGIGLFYPGTDLKETDPVAGIGVANLKVIRFPPALFALKMYEVYRRSDVFADFLHRHHRIVFNIRQTQVPG